MFIEKSLHWCHMQHTIKLWVLLSSIVLECRLQTVGIDGVEELVPQLLIWTVWPLLQNEETLAVSFMIISLSFKIATPISQKWLQGSLLHALRYLSFFFATQRPWNILICRYCWNFWLLVSTHVSCLCVSSSYILHQTTKKHCRSCSSSVFYNKWTDMQITDPGPYSMKRLETEVGQVGCWKQQMALVLNFPLDH
jgi:RNA polymerase subunit RPABC4/transcription elongation factor Spt4